MRFLEDRQRIFQTVFLVSVAVVLAFLMVYRFTTRTPLEAERVRAHIMLQRLYEIEQAYFKEFGTYLSIDRENHGELLQLNNAPGRFRYRVEAGPASFVAVAEADLDGNGTVEVWQVDHRSPEPVLKQQD